MIVWVNTTSEKTHKSIIFDMRFNTCWCKMQFYRLQYVSILENKAFLADLPSKSFLPSFTGKIKFTGHLPVNRWSGKISQITTLLHAILWYFHFGQTFVFTPYCTLSTWFKSAEIILHCMVVPQRQKHLSQSRLNWLRQPIQRLEFSVKIKSLRLARYSPKILI